MIKMQFCCLVLAISLLALFQCASSYENAQLTCIGKENVTEKESLPKQFMDAYAYNAEFVYLLGTSSGDGTRTQRVDYVEGVVTNGGNRSAMFLRRRINSTASVTLQFVFNESNAFMVVKNEFECTTGVKWHGPQKVLLSPFGTAKYTWRSFNELHTWAVHNASTSSIEKVDESNSTIDMGQLDHYVWTGCHIKKNDNGFDYTEVRVGYVNSGNVQYPDADVKGNVSLYTRVLHYTASSQDNEPTIDIDNTYKVTKYEEYTEGSWHQQLFMPAHGAYCNTSLVEKPPQVPALPTHFVTHIEYIDEDAKRVSDEMVYYIATNKRQIVAFTFNTTNADLEYATNLGLDKQITDGFIVHDFDYGIQYALSRDRMTCKRVDALPKDAGDRDSNGTLRTPLQFFMRTEPDQLVYAGEAQHRYGAKSDVFKTKVNKLVREISFVASDWSIMQSKDTLWHINNYHRNDKSKEAKMTTIRFYNMRTVPEDMALNLRHLDVTPCLKIKTNSYFKIDVTGATDEVFSTFGDVAVKESLIEQLAMHGNISELRIPLSQVYLRRSPNVKEEDVAFLLFEIAEPMQITDEDALPQATTEEAIQALNDTLQKGDISVKLSEKVTLTIGKESFEAVPNNIYPPPLPPPKPPKPSSSGASGGSMAVLAICMLIIGGIGGVVGAWFMWKRNRGIAYQIYE